MNARNWLNERFRGLNTNDVSLTALPSTPFAIAMPVEFSDATDNYKQQEEPDFNKPNNAIGEYKAGECPELAQQPNRRLEL